MDKPTPRRRTFTEEARRDQLIRATIELVAEHGYAATSLARVAEAAGITKAAVLYHVGSRDALVDETQQHVLGELVEHVGALVDAAGPADRPQAYVRGMLGHFATRPAHARVISEARAERATPEQSAARWSPLAQLIDAARADRGLDRSVDTRTVAVAVGGAIDAILVEAWTDPGYDVDAATATLVDGLTRAWLS